jgi:rapamycin-insensitive companion of mTOR
MLGTLSKYKEGIEYVLLASDTDHVLTYVLRLMEKFKVFTAFYHLSELRSREDLIKGIIENIDYSMSVTITGRRK